MAPEIKKCRNCQTSNTPDATFCRKCGIRLEETCMKCGQRLSPGAKFCRFCGTAVDDQEATLKNAGAPQSNAARELNPKAHESNRDSHTFMTILGIALVAVVIVVIVLIAREGNDNGTQRPRFQGGQEPNQALSQPSTEERNSQHYAGSPMESAITELKRQSGFRWSGSAPSIDWNVGPLAAISWDVQDLPEDIMKYRSEIRSSDPIPHMRDLKAYLSEKSRTLIIPVYSAKVFEFHGVPIVSEQFELLGDRPQSLSTTMPERPRPEDFNVVEETRSGDHPTRPGYTHSVTTYNGSEADVDRYLSAVDRWESQIEDYYKRAFQLVNRTAQSMRLKSLYLFPDGLAVQEIVRLLSVAFKGLPQYSSHELSLSSGRVTWDVAEWKDGYSVVRYVDISQNGTNLSHYIWIASLAGRQKYDELCGAYERSSRPNEIVSVLSTLKSKQWNAGYGWIRQRLGAGLDLSEPYLSGESSAQLNRRLAYPYSVAAASYCILFKFDTREMLESAEIVPKPTGNPRRSSKLTAVEKRRLFEEYMEKSSKRFPDQALEFLQKARDLYPDDPDLRDKTVPRFTMHEDIDNKEQHKVDKIVVDWQEGLEWCMWTPNQYSMDNHPVAWREVNDWRNGLESFLGGGWRLPLPSQLKDIQTSTALPQAMNVFGGGKTAWSFEIPDQPTEAMLVYLGERGDFRKTVSDKSTKERISHYLAVRPLNRGTLPSHYSYYPKDPKLTRSWTGESQTKGPPKRTGGRISGSMGLETTIRLLTGKIPDTAAYWVYSGDTIIAAIANEPHEPQSLMVIILSDSKRGLIGSSEMFGGRLSTIDLVDISGEPFLFCHTYDCGNMNCCGEALAISILTGSKHSLDCNYRQPSRKKLDRKDIEKFLETANDSLTPYIGPR